MSRVRHWRGVYEKKGADAVSWYRPHLEQVLRCMKPGGKVLVATFGLDGPERCSGLPVARYDAGGIHAVFGEAFEKVGEAAEHHQTPWGSTQSFVYCFCRRR